MRAATTNFAPKRDVIDVPLLYGVFTSGVVPKGLACLGGVMASLWVGSWFTGT